MKYIAIDQHNQIFYNLTHPRKDLMKQLNRKHVEKMYINNGVHIGYVIAGHWLTIYEIWESPKKEKTQ